MGRGWTALLVAAQLGAWSTAPAGELHLGVASCASSTCHGAATAATAGNIQGNEYVIWSRYDPHAGAWQTLLEERSVAMARRLGLGRPESAAACLDCHTDNRPASARGPRFQLADGIGCETCHGGASDWLVSHDDGLPDTRARSLATGMTDLTASATRAALCSGCHIGAAGPGQPARFASHALMAAGHPRLGFELETFSELWRTSGGRSHYTADADYGARKPATRPAAVWASGLAQSALAQAALIGARYGSKGALPDFALFNCYSCHRAMRLDEWRDKPLPASGGEPGALRFDDSTLSMLGAALAGRPELRAALEREMSALQRAPLASATAVRDSARRLAATLERTAAALEEQPLGGSDASRALDALVAAADRGAYPDYAGAEQAAMGIAVLVADTGQFARHRATVDALFAALAEDERYEAQRFREALRRLQR